jgi:hypothetical protein
LTRAGPGKAGHRLAVVVGAVVLISIGCGQSQPSDVPSSSAASPSPSSAGVPSASAGVSAPNASGAPAGVRVSLSAIRMPTDRSRAVAIDLGSVVLICGGLTKAGNTSSILQLDPGSGRISRAGDLAMAVHDAGGAELNGQAYVFGGGRTVAGSTVQRVDPAGTATIVGQLPAARADLAAVETSGEIVLVGGGTPGQPDGRVLATTDGHRFRLLARLPVPVRYPAVAVLDGVIYVAGGSTTSGVTSAIQAVEVSSGVVRIVGHLPRPISDASGFVIGNRVLIAGGRSAGRAQAELWQLDPTTGEVTNAGRLPYPVADAAAVVVAGVGYLIGGETVAPLASIITVAPR